MAGSPTPNQGARGCLQNSTETARFKA